MLVCSKNSLKVALHFMLIIVVADLLKYIYKDLTLVEVGDNL